MILSSSSPHPRGRSLAFFSLRTGMQAAFSNHFGVRETPSDGYRWHHFWKHLPFSSSAASSVVFGGGHRPSRHARQHPSYRRQHLQQPHPLQHLKGNRRRQRRRPFILFSPLCSCHSLNNFCSIQNRRTSRTRLVRLLRNWEPQMQRRHGQRRHQQATDCRI